MASTHTYDPNRIGSDYKNKLRFELGDTMVEGGADTCALSDEELYAILEIHADKWKQAKLMALESICRRFSYEFDTKVGTLSFALTERAKLWRADYESLKAEVKANNLYIPSPIASKHKNMYFYTGMMQNQNTGVD